MRPAYWITLASLAIATLAPLASADTSLDKYFSLRRQHQALTLRPSKVKADPASYQGKVFEIRGTLSGTAKAGTGGTFLIIESNEGSFVVSAADDSPATPGSKICMLVRVGERSTLSLSDLRFVAVAPFNEVTDREQRALLAEEEKKARIAARKAQKESKSKQQAARTRAILTQPQTPANIVEAYKNAIKSFNRRLSDADADTIARCILGFSAKYEVDPRLVVAVILAESHFNPSATSSKGAMGLGQLMPGTAAGLGVSNAYNPVENIAGSVRLIRGHLDKLTGNAAWTDLTWNDLALALASYNAGPGAVRKYGGVPPYRETQAYVRRVCSIYKKLCGIK